jgi:type II secretory pathway component PulJ
MADELISSWCVRHARVRGATDRSAFTLLEIILAMSLSVLLLAALYTVLKLHLSYAQKAPHQVQKTLQARAIVDRIARDVRALVPPATAPESSGSSSSAAAGSTSNAASSGSAGASTSGSSNTETAADSGSSASPDAYRAAYGLLGGTDWLQLYIGENYASLDDSELTASSGSVAQTSNILRVSYVLTVLSTRQDAKGRTQRLALTRSEVASIGAERMDYSSDDSDIRATTTYLSDDLAQVQFQYWDDTTMTWLDSWGVDVPIAPPRAIKVLVSLQDPDEYAQMQLGLSGTQSTWEPTFQLVIPVPTWVPESESGAGSADDGR